MSNDHTQRRPQPLRFIFWILLLAGLLFDPISVSSPIFGQESVESPHRDSRIQEQVVEGLRIQLREYGVSVTTICPGFMRTDMTDANSFRMPWLQEPDAAARKIVRALHRRKKVYNFPWQMAPLIKLLRWLPDWLIARTLPRKSDVGGNDEL